MNTVQDRTKWSPPPERLGLSVDELHVWRSSLDLPSESLERFQSTLCSDEVSRASRFLFEKDRRRYIAGRGILREILGKYLEVPASHINIDYGRYRKPFLGAEHRDSEIRFNVSHSNDLAVFAVTRGREVGIDVESIQPSFAGKEVAERFFSSCEIAEWRSLAPENKAEGFFLCWTRKEAYVKARGDGLHLPLQEFDVTLTPGQPATLKSIDQQRWRLLSFEPKPDYSGAAVVEGSEFRAFYWNWTLLNAGDAQTNQGSGTLK